MAVEDDKYVAFRGTDRVVLRRGAATPLGTVENLDFGTCFLDALNRPVGGGIVDDHDIAVEAFGRLEARLHGLQKQVTLVMCGDRDTCSHGGTFQKDVPRSHNLESSRSGSGEREGVRASSPSPKSSYGPPRGGSRYGAARSIGARACP